MASAAATLVTRPMSGFWRYYCQQLDRRPLLTRSLTGLLGGALGDAAAQLSERASTRRRRRSHPQPLTPTAGHGSRTSGSSSAAGGAADSQQQALLAGCAVGEEGAGGLEDRVHGEGYDWLRTARLAFWGAVVGAPMGYKWFQLLDARVCPGNPTSPRAVLTKTLLDQLLMAPFGTALFFTGIKTLEGNAHLVAPTLRDKYFTAMAANYMLWPAAHIVNFKYVPASQRILYVNAVAVVWTAVLSHLVEGHGEAEGQQQPHLKAT